MMLSLLGFDWKLRLARIFGPVFFNLFTNTVVFDLFFVPGRGQRPEVDSLVVLRGGITYPWCSI